jgi:hypothetical protein
MATTPNSTSARNVFKIHRGRYAEVVSARTALKRAVLLSSRSGSRPNNRDEFVAVGITKIGKICAVCTHTWRVLD